MRKHGLLLLGVLAMSCASTPSTRPRSRAYVATSSSQSVQSEADEPESTPVPTAHALPIPEAQKPRITRVAQLGRDLFLHEKAAGQGVTALEAQVGKLDGKIVRGFVATREVDTSGKALDSFVVLFFTAGDEPQIRYRVRVYPDGDRRPDVESLDPPEPTNPRLMPLVRARIATMSATAKRATPVVLPSVLTGEEGVVVYIINHSDRADIAVMGPHQRIVLSADGTQIKSTAGVGVASEEMVGADDWPIGVSHDGDVPAETHVYLSLYHHVRFFVATRNGRWHVDGDHITLDSTDTTTR